MSRSTPRRIAECVEERRSALGRQLIYMLGTDEMPTVRLRTLRRVVRGLAPPLVVSTMAPVGAVIEALASSPQATAVVVDVSHTVRGTVQLRELVGADADVAIERVMATHDPVMEPERDVDSARLELAARGADRVLVATSDGDLLGVLTRTDLERAARR